MSSALIPFDGGRGDISDEMMGNSSRLINALTIGAPGTARPIRARPGLKPWTRFPANALSTSPVTAMAMLADTLIYVTDDGYGTRDVFSVDSAGVGAQLSSSDTSRIAGTLPVRFAVGHDVIIATGGAAPQKLAPGVSARLGGNPPYASSAVFISQYLVLTAPDTSGVFFYDEPGPGGIETWDLSLGFIEAEAKPDKIVTAAATSRELYMLGEITSQLFVPDETAVFAASSVLDTGILAARSVIADEQTLMWFDTQKRFIVSDMRGLQVLSDAGIAEAINQMTTFSDMWGFRCKIGRHDLRVWSCPTDGRTFCFDKTSETWSEWYRWAGGRYQAWAPTSYLYVTSTGTHLVGMPDGTIAELSLDAHTDINDALHWEARTGFLGGEARRHCVEAQFPMKRGSSLSETASVDVSWRNDYGAFVPAVPLTLGVPGDVQALGIVSPAGEPYHRRQWAINGNADAAYFVGPGKEIFEEVDF